MITVNYLDGVDNIRCDEHLFQWDNGQKLCLSGLNTYVSNLETVDVHFCNKISKLAITVKPTVVSNNIVAPIPNSLLQDPYPIIAYFYVPSDNGSRTIVMVTIPIEPKKRPSDFILNEDEAIASLEAINNKVNTTLNNITVDYNDFKVRIEKELQDTVVNLKLDDAKTLQSHPASDFVLKTNLPTSLPANGGNADTVDGKHASDFVLKTNLPTSLPANGGNADTVDGKHASDFVNIVSLGSTETDTKTAVGVSSKTVIYKCTNWTDIPDGLPDGQGTIITINYTGSGTMGVDQMWVKQLFISAHRDTIYKRQVARLSLSSWVNVADGGNADKVDGFHASQFITFNGTSILKTSVDSCTTIGTYYVNTTNTTDLPSGSGKYGILDVRAYSSIYFQTITFNNNVTFKRTGTVSNNVAKWQAWKNVADASTVNGVKLMVGTREPQCEEPNALGYVPEGAWYGQY